MSNLVLDIYELVFSFLSFINDRYIFSIVTMDFSTKTFSFKILLWLKESTWNFASYF